MKNVLVLFSLVIIVLFSACKKSKTSDQPTSYRIDSVKDIVIGDTKDFAKWVFFKVVQVGDPETVTLSYEGLPPGIIIDPNVPNQLTGTTGFTGLIHLIKTDTNNIDGIYNIKLVCTGSVTGRKYYDLHLKVQDKKKLLGATIVPISSLTGIWGHCFENGYGEFYVDSLIGISATSAMCSNFCGWLPSPYVTINFLADGSIQVIPQNVTTTSHFNKGYEVSTSYGVYTADYMSITINFSYSGVLYTNYLFMQR